MPQSIQMYAKNLPYLTIINHYIIFLPASLNTAALQKEFIKKTCGSMNTAAGAIEISV